MKIIQLSNYKPILIVPGEPNSVFQKYFKSIKKYKYKSLNFNWFV